MDAAKQHRVRLRGLLDAAFFLAALGCAAGTVLGFFGAWHWLPDLFAHFRVQWFYGSLALAAWQASGRRRAPAAVFSALAAVNLAVILPVFFNAPKPLGHETGPLRALLVNVNREWGNPEKVLGVVRAAKPDFVVLEEIDGRWHALLAPALAAEYPHSETALRGDNFGIGLWSRHPFASATRLYSGDHGIPSILAELETPGGSLMVFATHPVPPAGRRGTEDRDGQLAELARLAGPAAPLMLVGDLNATPWCAAFKRLTRASGLLHASRGRGVFPTWPAFLPAPLRIPIDHVLHSPDIEIVSLKTGPRVRSDHLPVIVDFKLPNPD